MDPPTTGKRTGTPTPGVARVEEGKPSGKALELLRFNYENLHQSFWSCHRIAWTVTNIFIPVIFGITAFFIKDYNDLSATQAVMAFVATETLLVIWLLVMRILKHYNDKRQAQLKDLEKTFQGIDDRFKQYTLPMGARLREGQVSPTTIYYTIFLVYTVFGVALFLGKM